MTLATMTELQKHPTNELNFIEQLEMISFAAGYDTFTVSEMSLFIQERIKQYSNKLELAPAEVLQKIDQCRDCLPPLFYNESVLPDLDEVVCYATTAEMNEAINTYQEGFKCPDCGGISTNPITCTVLKFSNESKSWLTCGWSLLDSNLKHHKNTYSNQCITRLLIKSEFLSRPVVHTIFTPISSNCEDEYEDKGEDCHFDG